MAFKFKLPSIKKRGPDFKMSLADKLKPKRFGARGIKINKGLGMPGMIK